MESAGVFDTQWTGQGARISGNMIKVKQYRPNPGKLLSHRAIFQRPRGYFPVIKSLTILPTIVIPRIMPVTIARTMAR